MNTKEFEKAQYPCQFSKNNVVGAITFIFLTTIIFMSVFAYEAGVIEHQQTQEIQQLRSSLVYEQTENTYYRYNDKHLRQMIDRYEQERMLSVSVSAYTNRITETDSTPNLTATMDKVIAGYTVAVSHDLRYLLGHKVYIYGLGVFVVNDLMDNRWKMKVDVYFDKSMLKQAKKFGLKEDVDLVVLHKVGDLKYEEGKIKQYDRK